MCQEKTCCSSTHRDAAPAMSYIKSWIVPLWHFKVQAAASSSVPLSEVISDGFIMLKWHVEKALCYC